MDERDLSANGTLQLLWAALEKQQFSLCKGAIAGALLAGCGALLLPNQYRSSAKLMPPEQQALSSVSALSPLTGQLPAVAAGGLLNSKTPGAVSVGILQSSTVQNDLINRFDLRRVYNRKLYRSTRDRLAKNTHIEENRKNGIIDIDVIDQDPRRAQNLALAYIDDLNQLLNKLSTSSARREREFLEVRLSSVNQSLNTNTRALSQFSSRNATLDYQKQGQATLELAGKLEGELISAQSELSLLRTVYTDNSVQVRTAQAKLAQLDAAMHKITGQGQASAETLSATEAFPSIRQLPLLGATYSELLRKMTTDEALYVQLQKQYELARVQEAKEIPAIKVLDEPDFPEKTISPPRAVFTLLGAVAGALGAAGWISSKVLRQRLSSPLFAVSVPTGADVSNVAFLRQSG